MRRITFIAASIVSVLVIGYGGWLSSAESGDSGHGGDGTSHTGKPGEAPKH
jgi:hypothetical protein